MVLSGGISMSKRVLVVEDQEDNMQIMNDMLISAGYQVRRKYS